MSNSPPARLARWLGFDRNPLRRRSDRMECTLRLIALLGVVASVLVGIVLGSRTYDQGVRTEQEQRRTRHQTPALLVEHIALPKIAPVGGVAPGRARAEWKAPDGTTREGHVDAEPSLRPGDTVLVWTDGRGTLTRPPQDRETTLVTSITAGLSVPLATASLSTLLVLVTRVANQRRARRLWEAEWTIVEPSWRHHI